jgi:hypothetical protein
MRYRFIFLPVALYAVSMGYLEAAVVYYLRALYYPEGFSFPLKTLPSGTLFVEITREAATMCMLACVAFIAGRRFWERFGWFVIAFGVWDIAYYIWLKVLLDWPASFFEPDILFLIPAPWIGPVIAPALVSLVMIGVGAAITLRFHRGHGFRPNAAGWALAAAATVLVLSTFLADSGAARGASLPKPYPYPFLGIGLALYVLAYVAATGRK